MRKNTILLLAALLPLLLLPCAFALGISPARNEISYVPGAVNTYTYTVRGAAGAEIEIIKQSELADYIQINGPLNFTLGGNGFGDFSVTLTIPELTIPGLHEGLVGVQEKMPNAPGMTVARVAVLSQLWVRVPYPEKYLDFWFDAPNRVASGSVMPFTIRMTSRGSTLIESVSGVVEIFDSSGNSIALIPTTSASSLNFGDSASITADWPTIGIKAGTYKAFVTVNYDEKSQQFNHSFGVGEVLLEIVNVNASRFLVNSISKVPVIVTSKWNEPIDNVYATYDITRLGRSVAQLQTPSKTIQPWATDTLETYWDTNGLELGQYDATATVHYADKSVSMKKKFSIVEQLEAPELAVGTDTIILIVLTIIVIAIAAAYMRKRGRRRQGYYWGLSGAR